MSTRSGDGIDELIRILRLSCPQVATATAQLQGSTAPLHWRSVTLGDVPGVSEILGIVSPPVNIVSGFLEVVSAILDIVKALLIAIGDPIRAIIMAAYELMKSIIDDILATGAYLYVDVPGLMSNRKTLNDMEAQIPDPPTWLAGETREETARPGAGFDAWAATFAQSFDDPGDDDRPIFSDGAVVEAVFLVATMPNMVNFKEFAELWGKLIDYDKFVDLFKSHGFPVEDPDRHHLRGSSVSPDWKSWKLRDISPPEYPLRKLEEGPAFLLTVLRNVENAVGLLVKLIDLVKLKVRILQEFIDLIESVLDILRALSSSGFHVLPVATDEGVEGLKRAFLEAENRPNTDPVTGEATEASAIMGACFLSGTSNVVPFSPHMLWAVLGQGQSFEEAYAGVIEDQVDFANEFVEKGKDIKALGSEAWAGSEGNSSIQGQGIKNLWADYKEEAIETGEVWIQNLDDLPADIAADVKRTLTHIGMTLAEAEAAFRADRNGFLKLLEDSFSMGLGAPASPVVLAHIEANRRARRRGGRGLAMAAGSGVWPVPEGGS